MKRLLSSGFVASTALLSACATQSPKATALPVDLATRLVVANERKPDVGPVGISQRFALDGHMVGFAALTWTDVRAPWGPQTLQWRWYAGDRLIKQFDYTVQAQASPHYVWSDMRPLALGAGPGHVELRADDRLLASAAFMVTEPASAASAADAVQKPMGQR